MTVDERPASSTRLTNRYPELGTGPVDYDDCIDPEFFEDEKEAVFRRWWLYVGRAERLPRPGTYFTRELPGLASLVVARDLNGKVHAFHNVCAHRGNKVVWREYPGEEVCGSARSFQCKYHGWKFGLDGTNESITYEDQFYIPDRSKLAMPAVHCDEMGGFIFINLSENPPPLREFLGERICEIEAYPFHLMTERYGFTTPVNGNWKLAADTILEWYHPPYVHQRFLGGDVAEAEKNVPPVDVYHYELFGPHMLDSVPGPPPMKPRKPGGLGEARREMKWVYKLFRGGLFGPEDPADIGPLPEFINKGDVPSWGNDQFWLLPNLSVQLWARNFYITYQYRPVSVGKHVYDIDLYFVPAKTARERLAQELTVNSVIELAMQDVNTVEATHSALAMRGLREFHLSDQELMIRSLHHSMRTAVAEYRAEKNTANKNTEEVR